MKCLPIALLLLGFAAGNAVAQSNQATPEPAEQPAAGEENDEIVVEGEVPKEKRRVCEIRTTTGSIRPKRVCRTDAQIEEDARNARETMEAVNRDRETRDAVQLNRQAGG